MALAHVWGRLCHLFASWRSCWVWRWRVCWLWGWAFGWGGWSWVHCCDSRLVSRELGRGLGRFAGRQSNFGEHLLAERGWAVRRLVVAIGIAPEIGARGEDALVVHRNPETREGVQRGVDGSVSGTTRLRQCEDPHDKHGSCKKCEDGAGRASGLCLGLDLQWLRRHHVVRL